MKKLMFSAAAFGLVACHSPVEHEPAALREFPVASVTVAPVTVDAKAGHLVTIGHVKNNRESMVAAKVMGQVQRIDVKAGDEVRQGQTLMIIDSSDARARSRQAQGGLAQARAAQTIAKQMLDRFEKLKASDAASKAKYDQAVFDYQRATGAVLQAQGALSQARAYLSEATVRAPFAGRIIDKTIEEGEMANPGMPLLRIQSDSSLEFVTTLNTQDLSNLKLGQDVEVHLDAERGEPRVVTGKLAEIVPSSDMMTHSNLLRIDLGDADWLRSGMFGRAFFELTKARSPTIRVPADRLIRRGQLAGVFVVDHDQHVRLRLVRAGRQIKDNIEILSGLHEGDQMITSDNQALIDGQPAQVTQ